MSVFRDALFVFVGAGLGGVCRWGIGVGTHSLLGASRFPLATFLSNVIACALIGILAGISLREGWAFGVPTRLLLITGFLGGLSTMSAFGLETVALFRRGDFIFAGANICLTLSVCFGVMWFFCNALEP